MADIQIVYNSAQIRALMGSSNGFLYQDLKRRANAVLRKARADCPYRTGNLSKSLTVEMGSENGLPIARVGSRGPVEYALAVHEGTRGGQIIRPRRAKALRFNVGGKVVFAKQVRRGATRGKPFLTNAIPEAYR